MAGQLPIDRSAAPAPPLGAAFVPRGVERTMQAAGAGGDTPADALPPAAIVPAVAALP